MPFPSGDIKISSTELPVIFLCRNDFDARLRKRSLSYSSYSMPPALENRVLIQYHSEDWRKTGCPHYFVHCGNIAAEASLVPVKIPQNVVEEITSQMEPTQNRIVSVAGKSPETRILNERRFYNIR